VYVWGYKSKLGGYAGSMRLGNAQLCGGVVRMVGGGTSTRAIDLTWLARSKERCGYVYTCGGKPNRCA
jgi:hypothetical protein